MDNLHALDTQYAPPAPPGVVESLWVLGVLPWVPVLCIVGLLLGIAERQARSPRSHLRLVDNQPRRAMGLRQGPRRWRGAALTEELRDDAAYPAPPPPAPPADRSYGGTWGLR